MPDTGWWQNWTTVSRPVTLPSGVHTARLVMESSGASAVGNFDWFRVSVSTSALAVPGRIPATSFDDGGEGAAYHDDSAGNTGACCATPTSTSRRAPKAVTT